MVNTGRTLTLRDRKTEEAVEVFEVGHLDGTSNFDRFYDGLVAKIDFERFYLDDSADQED